jgi:hypothetical protein
VGEIHLAGHAEQIDDEGAQTDFARKARSFERRSAKALTLYEVDEIGSLNLR